MPQYLLSFHCPSPHPSSFCFQNGRKHAGNAVKRRYCKNGVFRVQFPGSSVPRVFKVENIISTAKELLMFQNVLPGSSPLKPVAPNFLVTVSEKIHGAHSQVLCCNNQGAVTEGFATVVFLVTNALMLAMPSEALAETCEPDTSFFNMPVLLFVALVGATVGGLLARQRKGELRRLNEQLRQINAALRRQAKIESYAPALSYAPVGVRIPESEVIVDPRKQELITHLKTGKNYLRNQDPPKAFQEFKVALELAQDLNDPTEEKKAARGLGASLQRQGKYRDAIKYHSLVLSISERIGEDSGNTDAYGAIADCYTELGDLEKAGKFYDEYISRLQTD